MIDQVILTLITQTPVLAAMIWFLVHITKQTDARFEKQSEQFGRALERIVNQIGHRIDNIDHKLERFENPSSVINHPVSNHP